MLSRIRICAAAASAFLGHLPAAKLLPADTSGPLHWTSEVKLRRVPRSIHGTLKISNDGVEFQPKEGSSDRWLFEDIRTIDLANPQKLSITTYQNRRLHLPGDRPFDFDLKTPVSPQVAAELIRLVGKPAINGVPAPEAISFATIAVHHPTRTGGSNGQLRFRSEGIDYLTAKGNDSRSWRWTDIQTVAHAEQYRLRVGGYLETFDFELKQPLSDSLFNQLWDHVYGQGLNLEDGGEGTHADVH